ncbi:MAG: hypothetical protein ACOYOK_16070 [Pseudobdellovibrionaceae bacterium]
MKSFIAILTIFLAQQSFACINYYTSQVKICPGDTVYDGDLQIYGVTIVGVNPFDNTVIVRSKKYGYDYTETATNLDIISGCIGSVCVGDSVYSRFSADSYDSYGRSQFPNGFTVVAINPYLKRIIIKSKDYHILFEENPKDLYVTTMCADYSQDYRQKSMKLR